MLAFARPAPAAPERSQRAVYAGTLAGTVTMTQTLHAELHGTGVCAHVICPASSPPTSTKSRAWTWPR
jgi:hypothetical protein